MANPFIPAKGYKHVETVITPRDKVVVVFHCNQDHLVENDPVDPANFLVVKKAVVKEKIPLNEYIQQFAHEVDLKEKIGRLRTKEEYEQFIAQAGLPANGAVYHQQDYLSDLEMDALIARGEEAWNSLDPELKQGKSKEEFLKEFNSKQFDAYVASLEAKQKAQETENKGGAE